MKHPTRLGGRGPARWRWACGGALVLLAALALLVAGACGGDENSGQTDATWTERELAFSHESRELHGVLSVPAGDGPHGAVVMVPPSIDRIGERTSAVSSPYYTDLAREIVEVGFAAYRYDPPGVGASTGSEAIFSLDDVARETTAALRAVREQGDIQPDRVGLWGGSQGAWVASIAAADNPDEVAFVITVSGSGVSVAEQQIYSIAAQSRAAGLSTESVERATLFGRLLVDWQLREPMYRAENDAAVARLGDGPWREFRDLAYDATGMTAAASLRQTIELLRSIQDEPWAEFLYLRDLYVPSLSDIPADQVEQARAAAEQSLRVDPRDHLSRVRAPLLAFFGENDLLQPTERSAALYARHLERAGNDDVTIVVLEGADHDIGLPTAGYGDRLSSWLRQR